MTRLTWCCGGGAASATAGAAGGAEHQARGAGLGGRRVPARVHVLRQGTGSTVGVSLPSVLRLTCSS
ncbi:unnamed protein product [Phytophthora fragariaefolia]|uniref:Unnamed protein product n=1 Tax=Phytophthora fragariaefolia TaxID=1490495 RepID=A0A9W7D1D8_9STRA|nr:unnamed protein product [Phytophthora fragariaefolia]